MKCDTKDCKIPHRGEFVKLGTDEVRCGKCLPAEARQALYENDGEGVVDGFTHIDAAWRCEGGCDRYLAFDEVRATCDQCGEETCDDCLAGRDSCRSCRDTAEYRRDVRSTR